MKQPVFEGLATAIVTPFRNGTIDIPTFEKLLDAQLAANVDAIVVCGTTGESATLSSSEQLTLTAHAMQYTAGRCKIIAGTGSNDTAHAIDLSRAASSMGVSAVLIVTPYYNKCTQTGLIAHYEAIAQRSFRRNINVSLRCMCSRKRRAKIRRQLTAVNANPKRSARKTRPPRETPNERRQAK